eukprot:TRINITY_DN3963_c1_g1_i2.p1 TRINITY_DN3963_c1_g1~~TRINITY_DN3963_c1_g1_i2.p1  ORF type:complete len:513 (+),score=133.37 TRINITY_DN3963_c1_g1_i2:4-1542(+)
MERVSVFGSGFDRNCSQFCPAFKDRKRVTECRGCGKICTEHEAIPLTKQGFNNSVTSDPLVEEAVLERILEGIEGDFNWTVFEEEQLVEVVTKAVQYQHLLIPPFDAPTTLSQIAWGELFSNVNDDQSRSPILLRRKYERMQFCCLHGLKEGYLSYTFQSLRFWQDSLSILVAECKRKSAASFSSAIEDFILDAHKYKDILSIARGKLNPKIEDHNQEQVVKGQRSEVLQAIATYRHLGHVRQVTRNFYREENQYLENLKKLLQNLYFYAPENLDFSVVHILYQISEEILFGQMTGNEFSPKFRRNSADFDERVIVSLTGSADSQFSSSTSSSTSSQSTSVPMGIVGYFKLRVKFVAISYVEFFRWKQNLDETNSEVSQKIPKDLFLSPLIHFPVYIRVLENLAATSENKEECEFSLQVLRSHFEDYGKNKNLFHWRVAQVCPELNEGHNTLIDYQEVGGDKGMYYMVLYKTVLVIVLKQEFKLKFNLKKECVLKFSEIQSVLEDGGTQFSS